VQARVRIICALWNLERLDQRRWRSFESLLASILHGAYSTLGLAC
jgi:hypothetical protein